MVEPFHKIKRPFCRNIATPRRQCNRGTCEQHLAPVGLATHPFVVTPPFTPFCMGSFSPLSKSALVHWSRIQRWETCVQTVLEYRISLWSDQESSAFHLGNFKDFAASWHALAVDLKPIQKFENVFSSGKSFLSRCIIYRSGSWSPHNSGCLPDAPPGWSVSNTDIVNNNLGAPIVMFVLDEKPWSRGSWVHVGNYTPRISSSLPKVLNMLKHSDVVRTSSLRASTEVPLVSRLHQALHSSDKYYYLPFCLLLSAFSKVMLSLETESVLIQNKSWIAKLNTWTWPPSFRQSPNIATSSPFSFRLNESLSNIWSPSSRHRL